MDNYDEDESRGRYTWTPYDRRTHGWGTRLTTPADDFTEPYIDWSLL